jgi:serine/threonine protein kinase
MFFSQTDRYKLIEELRKEGRSTIYRGFDSVLKGKVLIRITPINRNKDNIREGFEQGVIMADKLSHPQIVKIYDLGRFFRQSYLETEYIEFAYLVMEDLDWNTLAYELKSQKIFPIEKAIDVSLQLAKILEHVHQRNVIHKFINPFSIYWNGEKIKLTDFDLHRSFFDYNLITPKEGNTLFYLSPEQIEGKQPDARSDIFSLGVILYEMLTGKKPFTGHDYKSVVTDILNGQPPPPSTISDKFISVNDSILLKLLAKNPESRYQTATDVVKALLEFQGKNTIIELILKENELFKNLDDKSLAKISQKLKIQKFDKDAIIIKEGELGRAFYIIKSGSVKILLTEEGNLEARVALLNQGDCFGEMSLLTGEPSSATVRAATPVELLILKKVEFEKLLQEIPILNRHFHKLLAQRLKTKNIKAGESISKGFSGKLSAMDLGELIQTINTAQKTGVLTLFREVEEGQIYIKEGNIVEATVRELRGEKAFLEIAAWTDASFSFVPQTIMGEPRIKMGTHQLLMEAMKRRDDLNLSK